MENGESCCQHGKNDETAGEVDATKEDLRNPYSDLDFLLIVSYNQVVLVQCDLTMSFACSFSREDSCFSRSRSSLKVGLKIILGLPGVRGGAPGDFNALFSGPPLGVGGGR